MARKNRNHRLHLPPLELECMKALWALGRGTVHDIRARLLAERSLAYTTVLTLMDRLARKGIVEREKRGRAFLYRPLVEEDQIRQQALARLVGDFFQGSPERLRQYLGRGGTRAARPAETRPPPARQASESLARRTPETLSDPTLL